MAIRSLFKSGSKDLLQRIQRRDFSNAEEKQALYDQLAASPDIKADEAVRLLFSPDAALRQASAKNLAARKDPETIRLFMLASSGRPDAARRAAVAILADLPLGDVPVAVGRFLEQTEPTLRKTAADILLELPLSPRTAPLLTRVIDLGEAGHRLKAVQRLAGVAGPEHVAFFERLIDDADERIRQAAWSTVLRFASPRHLDLCLTRIGTEPYAIQQLLIQGIQSLAVAGGPEAIERILGLLASGDTGLRTAAMKILMSMPDRLEVVRRFIAYARELAGWVRERALTSLRELGPEVLEPMLELMSDPDPSTRCAALSLVAGFDDPRVGEAATAAIGDDDWWLALSAAELVGRLAHRPAIPALLAAAEREDVRWAAVEALGRIGGPEAMAKLTEMAGDSLPEVRIEALSALAHSGDPQALVALEHAAASDPMKAIRSRAVELMRPLVEASQKSVDMAAIESAVGQVEIDAAGPEIHGLLRAARVDGASDLHVSVDAPLTQRRGGTLVRLDGEPLTPERSRLLLEGLLDDGQRERLARDYQLDACFFVPNDGRYRGNLFIDRKGLNGVFRVIPEHPPTIVDLGLPSDVTEIASLHQGIVVITGPSGSGKSTTLAALVNLLNETRRDHILTIEDPIEFVHPFKSSLVNQRDISKHTESYANALRAALREDPDVIVVGELRDSETVSLALTAAETGHIVLTTLNATTAAKAVDRVINSFPADEQSQVRESFSGCLKLVIAQTLVEGIEPGTRVGCFEILKGTTPVLNTIRDNKTFQLPSLMQIGHTSGMRTFDDALLELVRGGKITAETAYIRAINREAFASMVSAKFLEEVLA